MGNFESMVYIKYYTNKDLCLVVVIMSGYLRH